VDQAVEVIQTSEGVFLIKDGEVYRFEGKEWHPIPLVGGIVNDPKK